MSILFSADYPQRISAMVLHAAMGRMAWAPDNPCGRTEEALEKSWGQGQHLGLYAQSLLSNDDKAMVCSLRARGR